MFELSKILLAEIKLVDLVQQYPKIDKNILDKIFQADPTNGKYAGWLVKIYEKGNLRLEDLYKATQYLEIYDKVKNKLPAQYKDINRSKKERIKYTDDEKYGSEEKVKVIKTPIISSLQDLYQLIKPYQEKDEHLTKNERIEKENLIATIGKWKIYIPENEAASCYLGSGTQWCTAYEDENGNSFDEYAEQGPLYVLIKTTINEKTKTKYKEKYQFHLESGQFMDEDDEEVNLDVFFKKNPELREFFNKKWEKQIINMLNEAYVKLNRDKNGFYYIFDGYSDIVDYYDSSSKKTVENILSNDFESNYDLYYHDAYDENMLDYLDENNENKIEAYLKNKGEWNDDYDLGDNLEFNDNEEIKAIIEYAYSQAIERAQEAYIFNEIISTFKHEMEIEKLEYINNKLIGRIYDNRDIIDIYIHNAGRTIALDYDEIQKKISLPDLNGEGDIDKGYFNQLVADELSEL